MKVSINLVHSFMVASTIALSQPVLPAQPDSLRTEIILIGTIHDSHNSSRYYDTQELKRILHRIRPGALLIEIPENQMGKDGRVRPSDRVGPELTIADEVASELGIPQIPFDHPNRNEKNAELLERWNAIQPRVAQLNEDMKSKNSLDLQFTRLYTLANAGLQSEQTRATSSAVNSDASDALTSIFYAVYQDAFISIAESYPGYDDLVKVLKYARDWWHERNNMMAKNILKAATAYGGRRLAVMTGSSHRYILRDLLAHQHKVVIREFWQLESQ